MKWILALLLLLLTGCCVGYYDVYHPVCKAATTDAQRAFAECIPIIAQSMTRLNSCELTFLDTEGLDRYVGVKEGKEAGLIAYELNFSCQYLNQPINLRRVLYLQNAMVYTHEHVFDCDPLDTIVMDSINETLVLLLAKDIERRFLDDYFRNTSKCLSAIEQDDLMESEEIDECYKRRVRELLPNQPDVAAEICERASPRSKKSCYAIISRETAKR